MEEKTKKNVKKQLLIGLMIIIAGILAEIGVAFILRLF